MTKNIISIIFTVLIVSGVIVGGAYAINKTFFLNTYPEEAVANFYDNWTEYKGNPLLDKIYKKSNLVTDDFILRIDQIINSFDKSGYDPILCAQDKPSEIKIGNTAAKEDSAVVAVEGIFSESSRTIEVLLLKKDGDWKIDDIVYGEQRSKNSEDADNQVSPVVQNSVGDYIKDNIAELSPKDPVLGGSFHVTSINFVGSNTCLVEYEDGHIALTAKTIFEIPKAEKVKIINFELLE